MRSRDVGRVEREPGDVSSEMVVLARTQSQADTYLAQGVAGSDCGAQLLVGPASRARHELTISTVCSTPTFEAGSRRSCPQRDPGSVVLRIRRRRRANILVTPRGAAATADEERRA